MKPIERAAMALWQMDQVPQDASPAMTPPEISDWRDYIPKARAVIAAIREPSASMIRAGEATDQMVGIDGPHADTPPALVWPAMIDALLAE